MCNVSDVKNVSDIHEQHVHNCLFIFYFKKRKQTPWKWAQRCV